MSDKVSDRLFTSEKIELKFDDFNYSFKMIFSSLILFANSFYQIGKFAEYTFFWQFFCCQHLAAS
ncbi:hypothetical protein [Okeania sp.]|uniref:hypothetical protein n=1 Tax=Okeania sp. TaxID=3100323 RepID=UPI002B4AD2D2|nr:hypothetical protein [Okeania sp.]MEB3339784.1 hypothetical protein [Okeania sp.]